MKRPKKWTVGDAKPRDVCECGAQCCISRAPRPCSQHPRPAPTAPSPPRGPPVLHPAPRVCAGRAEKGRICISMGRSWKPQRPGMPSHLNFFFFPVVGNQGKVERWFPAGLGFHWDFLPGERNPPPGLKSCCSPSIPELSPTLQRAAEAIPGRILPSCRYAKARCGATLGARRPPRLLLAAGFGGRKPPPGAVLKGRDSCRGCKCFLL